VPVGDRWRWTDPERPGEGETRWGVLWNRYNGEIFAVCLSRPEDDPRGEVLLFATIKSEHGRAGTLSYLELLARHQDEPNSLVAFADAVVPMAAVDERREKRGRRDMSNLEYAVLEDQAGHAAMTVDELLARFKLQGLTVREGLREQSDDELARWDPEYARKLAVRRERRRKRERHDRVVQRCRAVASWVGRRALTRLPASDPPGEQG